MTKRTSHAGFLFVSALVALGACSDKRNAAPTSEGDLEAGLDARPSGAVETGTDADSCAAPADGLPADVFCTGLYENHDATHHAPLAAAYTPGVTLWSDGAEKQRYLYLPPGTKIETSDMDAWKFPIGTKVWKEFRVDGVLVETRIFWKRSEAIWASGTYIWDSHASSATLNTSREPVLLANGYEIPTAKDCGKCHHGGADKLLGVEAVALALPTATGVTLSSLVAAGALSAPPDRTSIALPEDGTGKAGAALGYLHANCGMPCHSARGLGEETKLVLRLRADEFWPSSVRSDDQGVEAGALASSDGGTDGGTNSSADAGKLGPVMMTDIYRATVNQDPTTATVAQAFPGARRIIPGSHDQSLVWLLAHRRGNYQMPPLVSHRIDEVGAQKLADWIDALGP